MNIKDLSTCQERQSVVKYFKLYCIFCYTHIHTYIHWVAVAQLPEAGGFDPQIPRSICLSVLGQGTKSHFAPGGQASTLQLLSTVFE